MILTVVINFYLLLIMCRGAQQGPQRYLRPSP